jgi:hypothetical protein
MTDYTDDRKNVQGNKEMGCRTKEIPTVNVFPVGIECDHDLYREREDDARATACIATACPPVSTFALSKLIALLPGQYHLVSWIRPVIRSLWADFVVMAEEMLDSIEGAKITAAAEWIDVLARGGYHDKIVVFTRCGETRDELGHLLGATVIPYPDEQDGGNRFQDAIRQFHEGAKPIAVIRLSDATLVPPAYISYSPGSAAVFMGVPRDLTQVDQAMDLLLPSHARAQQPMLRHYVRAPMPAADPVPWRANAYPLYVRGSAEEISRTQYVCERSWDGADGALAGAWMHGIARYLVTGG